MSQPNSELGDFAGGMVEQPAVDATPMVPQEPTYRKQGFSIYTVMLILSFVCLAAASILLLINVGKYN